MVLFTHLAGRRAPVWSRAEELQTPTGGGAALPNHFICSLEVWLPYTSAGFGQGRRLKRKSIILSPLSVSFIPRLSVSISPTRYPTQSTLCKWKMSRRDHLAEPCTVRGKSPLSASMRHSVQLKYHRHYTGRRGADSGAVPPAPLTQVPLRVTYTKTPILQVQSGYRRETETFSSGGFSCAERFGCRLHRGPAGVLGLFYLMTWHPASFVPQSFARNEH